MTCRDASRLQSEALDRPLERPQRLGLRVHLLLCKWCRRYGEQLRFIRQAVQKEPESLVDPASEKLSSEARERMRRALRENKG